MAKASKPIEAAHDAQHSEHFEHTRHDPIGTPLKDWPIVTVHKGPDGLRYSFNFDPEQSMPWTPLIMIFACPCADELFAADPNLTAHVFVHVAELLRPAHDADARARIALGEPTVEEKGACEILGVGPTKLNDLRRAGDIPEPICGLNGRNRWLIADLKAATLALLVKASMQKSRGTGSKRKAPLNRYAQTKSARD